MQIRSLMLAGAITACVTGPCSTLNAATAPATSPVGSTGFELELGGLRFDPLISDPAVRIGRQTADAGDDYRLVQFKGPIRQAWLDALRESGLEPVQYIHPYTYVVWGNRASLERSAGRAEVRWGGEFLPSYRMMPLPGRNTNTATDVHVVAHLSSSSANAAMRAGSAKKLSVRPGDRSQSYTLKADRRELERLAATPGVYSVQPVPKDGGLRGEMSNMLNRDAAIAHSFVSPGYLDYLKDLGLDGSGVIIANVDGGIDDRHPDLRARMLPCKGTTCGGSRIDDHGTHTAAIMAADGGSGVRSTTPDGSFLRGLGMAPGAQLVEQVYDPFFTQPGGMSLLIRESAANGAVISGNSWGPAATPRGYDNDTRQIDVSIRDADPETAGDQPMIYVLSFMNGYGGYQTQGSPDESKNAFTIGSTHAQNSEGGQEPAIDSLSFNTAHGPALDQRRIPHMVAPGCEVDSAVSDGGHGLQCGTSMAAPHVSGAAALFVQQYRGKFDMTPSPALVKAAFTAVARDLAGNDDADGNTLGRAPDSKQGWGRMQLDALLAPKFAVQYIDQTHIFENSGETWQRRFEAADPSQPIRIMLTWTDAPGHGLGGKTPAWNNNLDLRVTAGETTYVGNALGNDGWSVGSGAADAVNNMEAVFLSASQHNGGVDIEVKATDINSNGLPNRGDDTDQDFALVCYNCK